MIGSLLRNKPTPLPVAFEMRRCNHLCVASMMAAFLATAIEAVDYKRFDGIHRVEKAPEPQITTGPVLVLEKRDGNVCGTGSKLCPSSVDGGCCPDDYRCAEKSCYATTKGPSTCGTLVGWYLCDAVYGGGCCPDGYVCQNPDQCIPPSGSTYAYSCPASYSLCPSSMSYGCCPTNMACATNQCYSTEPVTKTQTMVITTTEDGSETTYKTTRTTISTPDAPTAAITTGEDSDEEIFKVFPTAVAKAEATATSSSGGGGGGGLSTGALAGIIGGSVAFLIIVLVGAFIIIRHLNKVVAAVNTSKKSDGSKSRPTMKEFKPTDSEIDALSVDPLMLPPRPSAPAPDSSNPSPYNLASPDLSSNDHTPSAGVPGYHAVAASSTGNSRHTSFDANEDYFDHAGNHRHSHNSNTSAPTPHRTSNDSHGVYTHVRNWSTASDGSDGGAPTWNQLTISELEARPYVPELPLSPGMVFNRDERRRSSGSTVSTNRPTVSHSRQRNRSESLGQPALGVVDEEMHGFHGPADHLVGQTDSHRPRTRPETKEGNGQGGDKNST